MKREYSNFIITFIFFLVVLIVGMFVWPYIDTCRYMGMDCQYVYSFTDTLIESVTSSAVLSCIFYAILKVFRYFWNKREND